MKATRVLLFLMLGVSVLAQAVPTPTRNYYHNCLLPVQSNRQLTDLVWGLMLRELGHAQAGPHRGFADAYAYDQAWGDQAHATGYTWHASSWSLVYSTSALRKAAGEVSASGTVDLTNPPASGFGAAFHELVLQIGQSSDDKTAKVEGHHQTESGLQTFGTFTLAGEHVSWTFTPSVTLHNNTGSFPLTGPMPFAPVGEVSDYSTTINIDTYVTVHAEAYADGWTVIPYEYNLGEATATVVTAMTFRVSSNGKMVTVTLPTDAPPAPI
jgi:hypothetical protein